MIDLGFSAEQLALRDAARELFEKEPPAARLRALWNGAPRDDGLWRAMGSMGILGLGIPEAVGGGGGDETDLVLVLEEAGRAAVPEPLVDTVSVAAPVLRDFAPEELRRRWLPMIASGDAVVAVQPSGTPFVADVDAAGLLLLERDGAMVGVARGDLDAKQVPSIDGARRIFEVSARTGEPLAPGAADEARARGAAATAAYLNGLSMRLLEMTLGHVKARRQFGRPVGSFQAVKHKLASAHVLVEEARAAAWYAAYTLARALPGRGAAASVAKVEAIAAHAVANGEALQCHGGIGFTWEHDLHLWLKRGLALQPAYGTAAEHRATLAANLFREESDA